jgi:hypothetical protein
MAYRLLTAFESLFNGQAYLHRKSNLGDFVALHIYEDLFTLGKSKLLSDRIALGSHTINLANKAVGVPSRRGDGTFGERTPSVSPITENGYDVKRASVANIEIGVETKILAKAMIKQIDRVINDLVGQIDHFKKSGGNPITVVGIVGVNFAPQYISFEGSRSFPTDGKKYKHPIQESAAAINRLRSKAAPHFDEFLILEFIATNAAPFQMSWVNLPKTEAEYSSALIRISNLYRERFP